MSLDRRIINLDDYSTVLKELRTREFESYFNHQFTHIPESVGLSSLWFNTTTTGSGTAGRSGPDAYLQVTGSGDTAQMQTNEHGHYTPGSVAIAGFAVRLGSAPTDSQEFWAGYTNGTNGFGIGQDTTGLYLFKEKGGSRTTVRQSSWNKDTLDGSADASNKSGLELTDLQDGNIIRFPFMCYNQGEIAVRIGVKCDDGLKFVQVHRFVEKGDVSLNELNLPMTFKLADNSTGSTLNAYISAMHFERLSEEKDFRVNAEPRFGQSVGTSWTPLVSIKQRTDWQGVNTRPFNLNVVSDTDASLALLLGSDLGTSASFGLPELTSSSECAVNVDTSATSFDSTGEKRWGEIVKGGGGATKFSQAIANINFELPSDETITLAGKCIGSSGSMDSNLAWRSEF